jgi:hypothetical protein
MKILQPSRARTHEQLLTRIWACANGVAIRDADDMHVGGDDFQLGDVFMDQEHWDAYNAWKRDRWLVSAAAIQWYLCRYRFLPSDEGVVDETGYRQLLIEGAVYLMGDSDIQLEASYQDGVWHLEETNERGHYILDDTGCLWSVPVAICVPGYEAGSSMPPVQVEGETTLRYLGMAVHSELKEGADEDKDIPF